MPKDLLELRTFEMGLITNPSEQDVPEEAATFSKNIDSFNSDGSLAGVADDVVMTGYPTSSFSEGSGAQPTTVNLEVAKTINDDGVERVIFYENTSGNKTIRKIDGFNSASPTNANTLVLGAGGFNTSNEDVCMEVNNKEVHIGMGNTVADAPIWAGIINEGQFGEEPPSGVQGVKAELTAASSFTTMDHVVTDSGGDFIFGVEIANTNNPKVYKFQASTGTMILSSDAETEFTKICGMCKWDEGYPDRYLLVLDQHATNEYTLNLVSQSNLEIVKVWPCSDLVFADATQILHIHNSDAAKANIYVLRHTAISTYYTVTRYRSKLYKCLAPAITDDDTQAFVDMSFKTDFSAEGTHSDMNFYRQPGNFMYFNEESGHGHWDGEKVLFGNHHRDNTPGGGGFNILFKPYGVTASSTNPKVGMCAQFMMDDTSDNHTDGNWNDIGYCYNNAATVTNSWQSDGRVPLVDIGAPNSQAIGQPCLVYVNYNLADDAALVPEYQTTVADNTTGCILPLTFAGLANPWPNGYHECYSYQTHNNFGQTARSVLTHGLTALNAGETVIETYNIESVNTMVNIPVYDINEYEHVPFAEEESSATIDVPAACAVPAIISGNQGWHAFSSSTVARWASGYGTSASNYVAEGQSAIALTTLIRSSGGSLTNATKFFYKCSYMYDGYQESPLTPFILNDVTTGSLGNNDRVKLDIEFVVPPGLARVTHLNIYAAGSSTVTDTEPQGYYRLVRSLPLDSSWGITATNTIPDFGSVHDKTIYHRTHDGSSYEARTSISSALPTTMVNYGLSTQLNNHHIVANASNDYQDGSNFIFKSKPYNFDQFDWSVDYFRLPHKPTALASFNGRIYAFTENKIFKIELNSFYIEDTYDGIGCLGPEAVCVTEFGMFWCDKYNMYMNDGSQVLPIGNAVRENTDGNTSYRWQINQAGAKTRVYYNAKKGVVLFEYQIAGNVSYFYAWNIAKSRWDFYELKSAMNSETQANIDGMFMSQAGDTVAVINNGLYKLFDNNSLTRTWTWVSKSHGMGNPTQIKKFKKVRIKGTPEGSINQTSNFTGSGVGLDIDGSNATATGTVGEMTLSEKFNQVQLRLVGQTGVVDSVGYVYKRKPVH